MGKTRNSFGSVNASSIYPLIDGKADMEKLATVAFRMNAEEVEDLIHLLQDALEKEEEWRYLDITGFRETNQVTVTHYIPANQRTV